MILLSMRRLFFEQADFQMLRRPSSWDDSFLNYWKAVSVRRANTVCDGFLFVVHMDYIYCYLILFDFFLLLMILMGMLEIRRLGTIWYQAGVIWLFRRLTFRRTQGRWSLAFCFKLARDFFTMQANFNDWLLSLRNFLFLLF